MRIGMLLLAMALLVACDKAAPSPEHAEPLRAQRATASVHSVVVPASEDPADDCGLLHAQRFSDPLELARYYVDHDSAGVFLQTTPVTDSVYLCPNHLPGPDAFLVVKDTRLRLLTRTDTTAEVEFAGVTAGTISADSTDHMYLTPHHSAIADTFRLVRTAYGWRIDSPQLPDWVSGTAALHRASAFPLRPEAVDSIKAFIAAQRAAR